MKEPKVTVIIPTRERCDVLAKALQTVTTQDYARLEIIVSDNHSQDDTESVVRSTADPRVRYVNTGRRLSMTHNWEFALSHVKSGWVGIIGDDDGLMPGAVGQLAEIISATGAQAIRSEVCSYQWPSSDLGKEAILTVPLTSGQSFRSSRKWLAKVMRGSAAYHELPMLYNGGYVSLEVLNRIRAATGAFYRSCAPDVYAAVAIASVTDRYLHVSSPLAINGASRHSTGTSSFSEKGGEAFKKFTSEENIPFHPDLPLDPKSTYPLSLQAIVYECYLQSAGLRAADVRVTHEHQLEVILASGGDHESAVWEWGRLFAAAHQLAYDEILKRAMRRKVANRVRRAGQFLADAFNTDTFYSRDASISDVYEASLAAARVRANPPTSWDNLHRVATRVKGRLAG